MCFFENFRIALWICSFEQKVSSPIGANLGICLFRVCYGPIWEISGYTTKHKCTKSIIYSLRWLYIH